MTATIQTLFGAFPGPLHYPNNSPYEDKLAMRSRVCNAFGVTELPVERIFNEGSWEVPAAGRAAVVSISHNPTEVANGLWDDQIIAWVSAMDADTHYWLCLNHEPDQSTRPYTAAEQVVGFTHFAILVYAHRTSVKTKVAPILMSYTIMHGDWTSYLPDPSLFDALGVDAYWRPTTENTVDKVFDPGITAAALLGKRLLICETSMGAIGGHGGQMLVGGQYVDIPEDLRVTFWGGMVQKLNGVAKVVCAFETNKVDGNWLLEGHSGPLALYAAAVQASTG